MKSSDLSKKFYKIRDVAEILSINPSTLRYWESEFPEINPLRSNSNQRFYTAEDIENLRMIHYLIKIKGLKIEADRNYLKTNKKNITKKINIIDKLSDVRDELEMILNSLKKREDKLSELT